MPKHPRTARYPTHLSLPPEQRPPTSRGSTRLLKAHQGTVTYPDGEAGAFTYERLGPACHRFDFRWGDGSPLSRRYVTAPLGNHPQSIEEKAEELAPLAFADAIERERKGRFARVSYEPGETTALLKFRWRLCPCDVRQHGGKYALCLRIGSHWVRLSAAYDTLEEACDRWRDRANDGAVVCCCHRRNRRWEQPKYNPLHKEAGYLRPDDKPREEEAR
jgi:hypothetical protein